MENNRNRQIAVWVGLVIGIAVIAWAIFNPQGAVSPEEGAGPNIGKSQRERTESLRQEIRSAKSDARLLADRLGDALADKLLEDPDIRRIYQSNFHRFSAETLAKLTISEEAFAGGGMVQKFIATSDDPVFVHDYFRALGEHLDAKRMLLQHLGSDSTLLAPDKVAGFLARLPDLSEGEWKALGSGLRSRVRVLTKDHDTKVESLNNYLSVIEEPQVLRMLTPAAVEVMETDEAIEWLKEGDFEMMAAGDVTLMRSLKPDEYDKGFNLINHFIEDGQVERAQHAIEGFLPAFAAGNPRDALAWVDSLDHAVQSNQMRATVFDALYNSDPAEARALLEATEGPNLRSFYERLIDSAERLKELKAARGLD